MSHNSTATYRNTIEKAICYLIDETEKQFGIKKLLDNGNQVNFLKRDCIVLSFKNNPESNVS